MNFRTRERGQTAIEFLFTALFVMLFVLGFLELVMLVFSYNVLADSAKEGVRFAVVHGTGTGSTALGCNGPGDPKDVTKTCDGTAAGVKAAVRNYANHSGQSIATADITVTYADPGGGATCSTPGCSVEVQVSHAYRSFFGLGWPTVTMHATSEGVVTF